MSRTLNLSVMPLRTRRDGGSFPPGERQARGEGGQRDRPRDEPTQQHGQLKNDHEWPEPSAGRAEGAEGVSEVRRRGPAGERNQIARSEPQLREPGHPRGLPRAARGKPAALAALLDDERALAEKRDGATDLLEEDGGVEPEKGEGDGCGAADRQLDAV